MTRKSSGRLYRTGKLNEYYHYLKAMKEVNASIDTLETILTAHLQQARLDTVRTLLQNKQWNMYAVLEAMRNTPTDQYQETARQPDSSTGFFAQYAAHTQKSHYAP